MLSYPVFGVGGGGGVSLVAQIYVESLRFSIVETNIKFSTQRDPLLPPSSSPSLSPPETEEDSINSPNSKKTAFNVTGQSLNLIRDLEQIYFVTSLGHEDLRYQLHSSPVLAAKQDLVLPFHCSVGMSWVGCVIGRSKNGRIGAHKVPSVC